MDHATPFSRELPCLKEASFPRDAQDVMFPQGGRWSAANELLIQVLKVLDSCLSWGNSAVPDTLQSSLWGQAEVRLHWTLIFTWLFPQHYPASLIPLQISLESTPSKKKKITGIRNPISGSAGGKLYVRYLTYPTKLILWDQIFKWLLKHNTHDIRHVMVKK